jgi:hypothetical protein
MCVRRRASRRGNVDAKRSIEENWPETPFAVSNFDLHQVPPQDGGVRLMRISNKFTSGEKLKIAALVLALSAVATTPVIAADPATIDWSKIPTTNLTLFYPGQSSYEWLRSSAHPGSGVAQSGGACPLVPSR